MKIETVLIGPPLRAILSRYLITARGVLLVVVLTILLGSATAVAAPYLFSRLIDQFASAAPTPNLLWAFMVYAVLMGASFAIQRVASFLTFMTSESLNFVTSTAFFERIADKASNFFLDHNPTEIESAQH